MILPLFAGILATLDVGSPTNSDDLSRRCADVLASLAMARGLTPVLSGTTVAFLEGTIALRARVEARQAGEGRVVVAVAVESIIDEQPGFTVGSVGVGRDDLDAAHTAIQEWGALVGPALLGAVVMKDRSTERYVVDGYVAYPGATGFRGTSPPAWGAAEHQRLLASLRRALPAPAGNRLRSVTLTVMVETGQPPQGEARFDGAVAPSLWPALQVFNWPPSVSGYIFKQFYVLVPER